MNNTTMAGVTTLLFLMIAAIAGCANAHLRFEKPGVAAADLQRDQNECLATAVYSKSPEVLIPHVDRDVLIRCNGGARLHGRLEVTQPGCGQADGRGLGLCLPLIRPVASDEVATAS